MKKLYHPQKAESILIAISLFAVVLSGCSIWTNFTTYFNLYYNASKEFNEAEEQIKAQQKELFAPEEVKAGAQNKTLTSVIEKLSRLLQFYSESSYVDDALLMIGKSFYYQGDYLKALRKFDELLTKFPNSDLVLETKLWVGKADFKVRKYDEGNTILDEVKETAEKENENDILTQAYIEQISYLITTENYPDAINYAEKLIEVSGNDEMNASVEYEIGKLYQENDQLPEAAKAFAAVQNYSPDYETNYNSRLEYGKIQRQLGNSKSALEIFEDLKSRSIFNEYLDKTELQIGLALMDLNRTDEAFTQLSMVDTTYKQLPTSGEAKYYLGQIMEREYKDYDSANVYYSNVGKSPAPTEIQEEAKKKNLLINNYLGLRKSIDKNYRQLVYLENPDEFTKDSLAYANELARIDSLNKIKQEQNLSKQQENDQRSRRLPERQVAKQPETNQIAGTEEIKPPVKPNISADSINSIISKDEYELAGLFFTEFDRPDSAFYYYNWILNNHPNCPYIGRTLYALGVYYLTINQKEKADSLFEIVYDKYKNESIVNAAADKLNKPLIDLKYNPAEKQYLQAENILNENKYYEALSVFKDIYNNYPKSSFAPKALYAQGWIMENKLMKPDSAAIIYDSLTTKFAGTEYAKSVLPELMEYKNEQKRIKASKDSAKAVSMMKESQQNKKDSLTALVNSSKESKNEDSVKAVSMMKENQQNKKDIPKALVDSSKGSTVKEENVKEIKNEKEENAAEKMKDLQEQKADIPLQKDSTKNSDKDSVKKHDIIIKPDTLKK